MSEGGFFPWKVQKHVRKPTCDYSKLQTPLPAPPEGLEWKRDESREWRLRKIENLETPALVAEGEGVIDRLPTASQKEEEWELLSDRVSLSSNGEVLVARAASIRSMGSQTSGTSSVPFKIQRTHSSSTIDSCDNALGPAGKGVLGVDYVEHVILPSDTLQGLCLAYKISSTRLRQANHFSGNSLLLAPKKLVIPISKKALKSGFIRAQDTDAKEYKLHAFLADFPDTSITEAKAYLELADWKLKDAVHSAKEDREWEKEMDSSSLKSGEIRITMNMKGGIAVGYSAQGAGIQPKKSPARESEAKKKSEQPTASTDIPAIASKTVKAEDVYKAASQEDNFGVELKHLTPKKEPSSP